MILSISRFKCLWAVSAVCGFCAPLSAQPMPVATLPQVAPTRPATPPKPSKIESPKINAAKQAGNRIDSLPAAPAQAGFLSVFVLGEVARPGLVKLPITDRSPRLLDALRQAGLTGLPADRPADPPAKTVSDAKAGPDAKSASALASGAGRAGATARLLRNGSTHTIALDILRENDLADIELREGDVVIVALHSDMSVRARGAVLQPGRYTLKPGATAAALLKLAGVRDDAVLHRTFLVRSGISIDLDGEALYQGRQPGPRLCLGDILEVPFGPRALAVGGAARHPGRYDYRTGPNLLDSLARAGGWSNGADIASPVRVQLPNPAQKVAAVATDQPQFTDLPAPPITLQGVFLNGSAEDASVPPGALITLPERDVVTIIGAARSPRFASAGLLLSDVLRIGGAVNDESDIAHVIVMGGQGRGQGVVCDTRPVGMAGAGAGAGTDLPVKLLPGDVVWVRRKECVAVCGAVVSPTQVAYTPGLSIADLIKAGGGPTDKAAANMVTLLRAHNGALVTKKLDLQGAASIPPLESGDMIVVPMHWARGAAYGAGHGIDLSAFLSFLLAPPMR